MPLSEKDFVSKTTELKGLWNTRDTKIKAWYDLIRLTDTLAQTGMETVVSNDPKTGYNLGKHLLTSSIVAHKVDVEELNPTQIAGTAYIERFLTKRWAVEDNRYRSMGRQSFKGNLIAFMLATGWYFMFSGVTDEKIMNEVWNPFECYPRFGSDGLVEHAHIYILTRAAAKRKCKLMEWPEPVPFPPTVTMRDYWGFDDNGDLVNGIMMGNKFVKPIEVDVAINKLIQETGESYFPVFASPIGGLPDEGSIVGSKDWQSNFGESIVASNESLALNYNKMLSFTQQATRSAAHHRWYEKSAGDYEILKEQDMDKFGAIFRMGPNDDIGPLAPPPIPVELRTIMFEYGNMLQRGMFPAAVFGNVQQQMSYLAMANVASASMQTLTPFNDAFEGGMSDIDNYIYQMLKVNRFNPYGFKMPQELPEDLRIEVTSDVEIPGYLIQRATVARMLDPNFKLPTRVVMDKFFPEIRDPLKAMGESRKDAAMMHPKAIMADQVIAYKEHAKYLHSINDAEAASLYEKLAASIEAEIVGQPTQQQGVQPPNPAEQAIQNEAFPQRGAQAPMEGMGQI